jgi:hypothetical protein
LNPHDRLGSADFKSAVSADFTIRASSILIDALLILHTPPKWNKERSATKVSNVNLFMNDDATAYAVLALEKAK